MLAAIPLTAIAISALVSCSGTDEILKSGDCNGVSFNDKTHFCDRNGNGVYARCSNQEFDPETQFCMNGKITALPSGETGNGGGTSSGSTGGSGFNGKYCDWGTCIDGNGWACEGGGGCYGIGDHNDLTEASCKADNGVLVDSCPASSLPPAASNSGSGSNGSASICKDSQGRGLFCEWPTGCYLLDSLYFDPPGQSCSKVISDCGSARLYVGVTGLNEANDYGKDLRCANQNGKLANNTTTNPSSSSSSSGGGEYGIPCGSYCKWGNDCYELRTDPDGKYSDNAFKTCDEVIVDCDYYSDGRFNTANCTGTNISVKRESCGGYCLWNTGCWEIQTDPAGLYGDAVATCTKALSDCEQWGNGIFSDSECSATP
jgi:hypothetical protein